MIKIICDFCKKEEGVKVNLRQSLDENDFITVDLCLDCRSVLTRRFLKINCDEEFLVAIDRFIASEIG